LTRLDPVKHTMYMIIEDMYKAKKHLSRLVEKALQGEEVLLAKFGKPLVQLIPVSELSEPVKIGLLKEKIEISDDFNDLSPEIEKIFEGYLP
jgi:prevent-host-death family protein